MRTAASSPDFLGPLLALSLFATGCGADRSSPEEGVSDLGQIVALVDLVLDPAFDVDAAQRRFGPIEGWTGAMARVSSRDATIRAATIETLDDRLTGVQVDFSTPIVVEWDELVDALGPAAEGAAVMGLPATYRFDRRHPSPGRVHLRATRTAGAAAISSLTVRR